MLRPLEGKNKLYKEKYKYTILHCKALHKGSPHMWSRSTHNNPARQEEQTVASSVTDMESGNKGVKPEDVQLEDTGAKRARTLLLCILLFLYSILAVESNLNALK